MKLFIGGLPYQLDSDTLRDMFALYGEVEDVRVIRDKLTGGSLGFGFIDMLREEEAMNAINGLSGTLLQGRQIVVSVARPVAKR